MMKVSKRKIDEYILDSIETCPRATEDDTFLVSLVYEKYLGEEKAEIYGIKWCMENFAKMKLPAPPAVILRKKMLMEKRSVK